MVWLHRIVFLASSAFLGLVTGTYLSIPFIPAGSGLAAPAIAFSYGLGSAALFILTAGIICTKIHPARLQKVSLSAFAIALIVFGVFGYLFITETKVDPQNNAPTPTRSTTVPN